MKFRLLVIFVICCFNAALKGQTVDTLSNAGVTNNMQIPTVVPVKPAKVYPVDTQAVLRMLEFDKIGYDSIFSINTGPPVIDQPAIKHVTVKDFILPVLLLIMLGYVTWLRYVFAKELSENITVIINSNLGQQIYRDREFSANIFKLLTFFNFACSAGLFIFLLTRYYHIELPFDVTFYNIILCIGGVGVLYLIKGLSYRILGATFKISNALQFFRFNALVIYHLLGIGMLPFIILAAFADPPVSNWAIVGTLILIGIALLIRFVKGFTALRLTGRFHFVYFLLYICALEIAPLLIAIKVFLNWA